MMQSRGGVNGQHEAWAFGVTNLANANGSAFATEPSSPAYVALHAGSIIGLSVRHNADLTGGTITWKPTVNGTAKTGLTVVTDDTHQQDYDSCQSSVINFAAGDYIGVAYTKSGTVAPETTDIAALLRIVYHNVDM